jgi:hypothetical protein
LTAGLLIFLRRDLITFSFCNSSSGLKVRLAAPARSSLGCDEWAGQTKVETRRKHTKMGMIGEILDELAAMFEKPLRVVSSALSVCVCVHWFCPLLCSKNLILGILLEDTPPSKSIQHVMTILYSKKRTSLSHHFQSFGTPGQGKLPSILPLSASLTASNTLVFKF